MKKQSVIISFLLASTLSFVAYAEDLNEIYKQALQNDQLFKSAEAQFLATKEKLPIARALLLPNISATAGMGRNYYATPNSKYYYNPTNEGASITQPIFNYTSWATVQNAGALVQQAEAQYFSAIQALILRTAVGYFGILEARDVLQLARAQKKSLERRLKEERQRYEVGLIPITNVYEIKANYDTTCAAEIAAENDLSNKIEKLREIIGKAPGNLAVLGVSVPYSNPDPQDINQWMKVSEKQNYTLLAANYATIAARDNIKMQFGGHLPTVTAQGGYQFNNGFSVGSGASVNSKSANLTLNLVLPVYSGGAVSAQVRAAEDSYNKASADQEFAHRDAIMQTRQAYLGIMDAISKMRADKQAIISSNGSLKALEAQYHYGTRTMADVLNQETALYQAQRDYALDQYNYIRQTLTLKQAAGTLSGDDLIAINKWLHQGDISEKERIIGISNDKSSITSLDITEESRNYGVIDSDTSSNDKTIRNKKSFLDSQKAAIVKSNKKPAFSKQKVEVQQPAPSLVNHYAVQISASSDKYQAVSLVRKYSSIVNMQYIVDRQNDGQVVYKVIAGDYTSLGAAIATKEKFAQIGVQGWVRTINK